MTAIATEATEASQPTTTSAAAAGEPGQVQQQQPQQQQPVNGRSAFAVETAAAGVVVSTVFASDDGRMLALPAVFPHLGYALEQIDMLRSLVIERFAQAAQVGAQVIALQRAQAAEAARAGTAPAAANADQAAHTQASALAQAA